MNASDAPTYSHTQKAPLYLILYGTALWCFVAVRLVRSLPALALVLAVVGVLMAVLGLAFQRLTVEDQSDRLAVRFGPLPLFRRNVRYDDMERAEIGRTTVLDGWGIHLSLRGGWVWNLWGRDCVVIYLKNGGVLRVGTDDADNLARFLEGRIAHRSW